MALNLDDNEYLEECESITDLSNILNLDLKKLLFFAYKNSDLYVHYSIRKKSGGTRMISAPSEGLKTICRKLAFYLDRSYYEYIPSSVHGFISDRSVISNAKKHLGKKYILNLDLEDFFGTINSGRIMGLLRQPPFFFGKRLASVISGIVTLDNSLPQGSPTSPVLSNMVCLRLDKDLTKLAQRMGWTYTRYADDITFSSSYLTDDLVRKTDGGVILGAKIKETIEKNGFLINRKKTRLAEPGQSKWVTGVKVNKECNVSRTLIRQVRAMLHAWEKYEYDNAEKRYNLSYNPGRNKSFRQVLRGKIDHIGNVKTKENPIYIKLYNRLCDLEGKYHKRLPVSFKDSCEGKVLMLKSTHECGSGFFISKNFIVTCSHVVGNDTTVLFTVRGKKFPVEYKSASVVEVDKVKDYAILHTYSDYTNLIISPDYKKTAQQFNNEDEYISIGYGGFRTDGGLWDEPCSLDQKIVQKKFKNNMHEYSVNNAMWSGMSGGPVVSRKSRKVEGFIISGAASLQGSVDIKSFIFRPLSIIPEKYFCLPKDESNNIESGDVFLE